VLVAAKCKNCFGMNKHGYQVAQGINFALEGLFES